MKRSPCNTSPVPCATCARPTREPRRGECFACYQRARRGHATGAACAVCALRDRRMLRRHSLADGWATLCANHASVAGRRALTLGELVAECTRPGDRRQSDRRSEDRRSSERRARRADLDVLASLDAERRARGRRAQDAA